MKSIVRFIILTLALCLPLRASAVSGDDAGGVTYTPTTSTDWPGASWLPKGEVLDALDSLALVVKSLWYGGTVVNLSTMTGADVCANIQAVFSAAEQAAGANTRHLITITGKPTTSIPVTSFYAAPGGEYNRCFTFMPSVTYVDATGALGTSGDNPVGDQDSYTSSGSMVSIVFDKVILPIETASQTKPSVVFQLGNGYGRGFISGASGTALQKFTTTTDLYGSVGDSVSISGDLTVRPYCTGGTCDSGSGAQTDGTVPFLGAALTAGSPVGLPLGGASGHMSATSLIGVFATYASRVEASDWRVYCRFTSRGGSFGVTYPEYDDVCFISQYWMMGGKPSVRSLFGGVGTLLYGTQQGQWQGLSSAYANYGIMGGDPWNSGDYVISDYCTRGYVEVVTAPTGGTPVAGQSISWDSAASTGVVVSWDGANSRLGYRLLTGSRINGTDTVTNGTWSTTYSSNYLDYCGRRSADVGSLFVASLDSTEGNFMSNAAIYDAYLWHLTDVWFETFGDSAIDAGASVYIGAGTCATSGSTTVSGSSIPWRPCWRDADCSGGDGCYVTPMPSYNFGTASKYQLAQQLRDVYIESGQCIGQKALSSTGDLGLTLAGIALGPGAQTSGAQEAVEVAVNGAIRLNTCISATDTNSATNDSSASCYDRAFTLGTVNADGTGNSSCTSSLTPYPCCTGAGAGTCEWLVGEEVHWPGSGGSNVGVVSSWSIHARLGVELIGSSSLPSVGDDVVGLTTGRNADFSSGGTVDCRPFVAHASATSPVHLENATWRGTYYTRPPNYRRTVIGAEDHLFQAVNETDFDTPTALTNPCLLWGRSDVGAECSNVEAEWVVPHASWVQSLTVSQRGATVASARACDIEVQVRRSAGAYVETVSNNSVDHIDYGGSTLRNVGASVVFDVWRDLAAGDSVRIAIKPSANSDCINGSSCNCTGIEGAAFTLTYTPIK